MTTHADVDAPKHSSALPQEGSRDKDKDEKVSPSTFLPHFKGFNIDHAKYKHYGHSMTSQQLNKIINTSGPDGEEAPKSGDSPSESSHVMSPLESPSEHMAKALELPAQKLYSEAVVSQMLSLRIEQEKTKQIHEKIELGRMVSQLIKDTEAHGFGSALIRRLFLDEDRDEYRAHVEKIRENPPTSVDLHQKNSQPNSLCTPSPNKSPVITPEPHPNSLANPLANPLAAPSHPYISRFPPETRLLPPLLPKKKESHVRARSDGTIGSDGSPPAVSTASTTPGIARPQTSPSIPLASQGPPPVFYPGLPEHHYVQNRGPPPPHPQSTTGNSSESGSPRLVHKQAYPSMPRQHPEDHVTYHPPPQHQYGHPVYYVNSSPPGIPGGPMGSSQYYGPPPMVAPVNANVNTNANMHPWATPVVPQEKKKEIDEDHHAHKKQRGTKGGISFMISTPKNPPARKYNKSSGNS